MHSAVEGVRRHSLIAPIHRGTRQSV